jgi:hypothetical protein
LWSFFAEVLLLNRNKFTGPLPTRIGRPAYMFSGSAPLASSPLIELNLADNALTGSIPNAICDLIQLEKIILNGNQFRGPIPPCISSIGTF